MKIHLASLGKRIIAFACDLVLVMMLGLCLQTLVVMPIAMQTTEYTKSMAEYLQIKDDSHLFEFIDGNQVLISEDYDEHLTLFYDDYLKDISIYNKQKEESQLFELKDEEYVLKTTTTADELEKFYKEALEKAEKKFYDNDHIIDLSKIITITTVATISISTLVSLVVFFLVIPLCLKNGQTIGKLAFGYGITNKRGYKVKKSQIIIRFLVFLFLEVILSIFLFGIPLFISFTMASFNKYGTSLHDYFAVTAVVETRNVTIYKDEIEMQKDIERINSSPEFSLFKK